jgi:hypothetical protein
MHKLARDKHRRPIMNRRKLFSSLAVAAILARAATRRADAAEIAVAPQASPPGGISRDQVFVTFTSPAGYRVMVPRGWARKDGERETVFNDKHNRVALAVASASPSQLLDIAYAQSTLAPEIERAGRAVRITELAEVTLKPGRTLKIAYDANSEPHEVTNKRMRQEIERFYFVKNDKLVMLSLTAPKGTDNAEHWRRISSSFRWV